MLTLSISTRQRRRWAACLAVCVTLGGLIGVAPGLLMWAVDDDLRLDFETSRVVVDRNERLLRPFTTANGLWRLPADLAQIDSEFIRMLVAYEDRRFDHHDGVDLRALARAGWQMIRNGRIISGASTITMQTVRLISGEQTRSLAGKLKQIARAWHLERRYSKPEILQAYLTLAPYGGNLEGVRAASLAYYGSEPQRLTVSQAALLVALPQAPERRRPDRHAANARRARDSVLSRLSDAAVISRETALTAAGTAVSNRRRAFPMLAAHRARRALGRGQQRIQLSIDGQLQARLERLADARVQQMSPGLSVAIVVADHRTGEILASLGSARLTSAERDGYIDMTDAVRSPGSTLKPLIYGLAFEQRLAHPQTLIDDAPVGWGSYRPQNFDRGFRGTIVVREALAQSLNIPALLLLDAVGPARLMARMKRAGMAPRISQRGQPPGLAIGLGGLGVSLRDLVRLYGSLARNGRRLRLREIVRDHGSKHREPGESQAVIAGAAAWQVSRILLRSPPPDSAIAGRIAYKTGTSYGYRDAWSVGYDGRAVVGVWVGRPDGRPVAELTGRSAAAPLLFDTFARLGRPIADLVAPPTRVATAIPADAPAALAHFRAPGRASDSPRALGIVYPPNGARVDLGLADTAGPDDLLAVKLNNGEPPFTWLVNGRPVVTGGFRRHLAWQPTGPGATTITVIDGSGRSDRVSVFLE